MLELPQGVLTDVFLIPVHVAAGATTDSALGDAYSGRWKGSRVPRQGRYLRKAAALLGLVENLPRRNFTRLTAAGQAYVSASPRRRAQIRRDAIVRFATAREVLRIVRRLRNPDEAAVEAAFPRTKSANATTIHRRMPTFLGWLVEVGLLRLTGSTYTLTPIGVAALADNAEVSAFLPPKTGLVKKSQGRTIDVERRAEIEQAAVKAAIAHYTALGYDVLTCERENKGWDLEVSAIGMTGGFKVEVKGTSRTAFAVELTRNEYDKLRAHRATYRVVIVTDALGKPRLREFIYDSKKKRWFDPVDGRALVITDVTTAVLT